MIFCSDQTREVLISAAFVHLKNAELSKHIRNLSAASRAILLSGPTGSSPPAQKSICLGVLAAIAVPVLLMAIFFFSFWKLMVILLTAACAEPYLQSLAKALSHYFKARLLILDATDFSLRVSGNCNYSNFDS